jgi:hypothetical protein
VSLQLLRSKLKSLRLVFGDEEGEYLFRHVLQPIREGEGITTAGMSVSEFYAMSNFHLWQWLTTEIGVDHIDDDENFAKRLRPAHLYKAKHSTLRRVFGPAIADTLLIHLASLL